MSVNSAYNSFPGNQTTLVPNETDNQEDSGPQVENDLFDQKEINKIDEDEDEEEENELINKKDAEQVVAEAVRANLIPKSSLKKLKEKIKDPAKVERGKRLAEFARQKRLEKGIITKQSKSKKAGVIFSVDRILNELKKSFQSQKISSVAGVYLAAVMEYLCAEVLELAGDRAHELKRNTITPRHILLATKNDIEINEFLKNVTFAQGGVIPHIHQSLLNKSSKIRKKTGKTQETSIETSKSKRAKPKAKKQKEAVTIEESEEEGGEEGEDEEVSTELTRQVSPQKHSEPELEPQSEAQYAPEPESELQPTVENQQLINTKQIEFSTTSKSPPTLIELIASQPKPFKDKFLDVFQKLLDEESEDKSDKIDEESESSSDESELEEEVAGKEENIIPQKRGRPSKVEIEKERSPVKRKQETRSRSASSSDIKRSRDASTQKKETPNKAKTSLTERELQLEISQENTTPSKRPKTSLISLVKSPKIFELQSIDEILANQNYIENINEQATFITECKTPKGTTKIVQKTITDISNLPNE